MILSFRVEHLGKEVVLGRLDGSVVDALARPTAAARDDAWQNRIGGDVVATRDRSAKSKPGREQQGGGPSTRHQPIDGAHPSREHVPEVGLQKPRRGNTTNFEPGGSGVRISPGAPIYKLR